MVLVFTPYHYNICYYAPSLGLYEPVAVMFSDNYLRYVPLLDEASYRDLNLLYLVYCTLFKGHHWAIDFPLRCSTEAL